MKGFMIFISFGILNFLLFMFSTIFGMIIIDLAFIMTLLVMIYENQNKEKRARIRKRNASENRELLAQLEKSKNEFDPNDLPSKKDVLDVSNQFAAEREDD